MSDDEVWATIPGFHYSVSTLGRVRNDKFGRILKAGPANTGYPAVVLMKDSKKHHRLVHRLVVETFIRPITKDDHVNHLNAVKADSRLMNLEVGTRLDNVRHAKEMGLFQSGALNPSRRRPERLARGERHGNSKLTADRVRDVRRRLALGESGTAIAKTLGVSQVAISDIKRGARWGHLV